jgi:glycosyltransferase involved in cell wall biosynthesis
VKTKDGDQSDVATHDAAVFAPMFLSVIVPAYNEESRLEHCLPRIQDALAANRREGFSWEIIVCDNNSADQTADVAAKLGATVITEAVNQISRARNTGANAAHGQWLLFIDADSYPPPELIAEVLDLIAGGQHIGCGTTVTVNDGTLFNKLRMERLNPLFRLFRFCGGVFLLCEREAFDAIGGFSDSLFAFEEIDFVARLKWHGRAHGKKFAILHRHPVITSGRKGDYRLTSIATIVVSNVAATFFLLLSLVVPRKWMPTPPRSLLAYWYRRRG